MYDSKKARMDAARARFDRQASEGSPDLYQTAKEYLEILSDFIRTFNDGPGADPRLMALDTTGELRRMEEQAEWAEDERRRVRRVLAECR